jgi:hypothetical protein
MKAYLLTAALVAFAAPAFAGPFENLTGCETAQADNSNFTVRVDPTCAFASDNSGGDPILAQTAFAMWVDVITPDDEDE